MARDKHDRMRDLSAIMAKAHALAEVAWPRDGVGRSEMPEAGLHAIMDIQMVAEKALRLPENTPLLTGDWVTDSDMVSDLI